jgi:hypothetical protein
MASSRHQLDLQEGTVSGSAIGACVQIDGYDVGRLSNAVRYEDNDTNLESTSLPVPELPALLMP